MDLMFRENKDGFVAIIFKFSNLQIFKSTNMQLIYTIIFLLFSFVLSAQNLEQAKILVDSAEFLIYEDMDLELAQQLNQRAAVAYIRENDYEGQVHCQINNAIIWAQKDSFALCLELLEIFNADIPSKIPKKSHLAGLILTAKAWCLWGVGKYKDSYDVAVNAADILRGYEDWDRFVDASLVATYSIYFNDESNFSDIDKHILETYEVAIKELPHSRLVFKYIYQLYGSILYQEGRIDEAIHLTHQGLDFQYRLLVDQHLRKDSIIVAKYYSNLGRMYAEENDVGQGIAYYKNAYLFYERLNKPSDLVKLCMRLGDLYIQDEKEEESDVYYSRIPSYIPLMSKDPIVQRRENNFEHMAMAYYYLHFDLNDSILSYYNKNIAFIKKHNLAIDQAYINIGAAFEGQKNYSRAEEYYLKALEVEQKKYGHKGTKIASMYFRLGRLAAESGNSPKAISYMDRVITLLDVTPVSQKDKVQLLEYLLDKSIAIEAYRHRGDAFVEEGSLVKAHSDFNSVILLANYLRDNYTGSESKLLSINKLRPVYERAAANAWKLYKNNKNDHYKMAVFNYAEHSKSTLLNENILKFRNDYKEGGIGVPKEFLHQEEKYIIQIDKCKERISESKQEGNTKKEAFYLEKILHLEQALDSFEQSLQATYPSYRSWDHGRDSIVSPEEVQVHLGRDELFIEYFISDKHFFVIYISKEKIKIKEIPNFDPRHYKSKVRNLRRTLSNVKFILEFEKEAYNTFCEEAHWFYTRFLEDDMLKGKKHLIIVPDKNLHYIPFEVLLTKAPNNKVDVNYQGLNYLIRDYSIHYEYSAAIMVNTQQRTNTSNGRILGFAATYDNNFKYKQLSVAERKERTFDEINLRNTASEIPGTLEELKELSRHFHGDFFEKEKANEHTFKQVLGKNEYSVIHLAMHGVVNYDNPAYSSLMFTEDLDSLEDNLLYSYETQHLSGQNANLIVLSACKTGYGKYAQGEGIISLGRSFMYAGIPSIVMTLWEINDQTSVEVMKLFYDNLVAGQTKDEALRHAKLDYLESNSGLTAHPFFWATFVCIGNQQAIPLEYKPTSWIGWGILILFILVGVIFLWRK
jgi:CHAT domain-containing protein